MADMSWIVQTGKGVMVTVRATPRAARNQVQGLHGEALKVRLQAPPVDGKANDALIRFVADILDIPHRNVLLVSGETSRQKRLLVVGVPLAVAQERLLRT